MTTTPMASSEMDQLDQLGAQISHGEAWLTNTSAFGARTRSTNAAAHWQACSILRSFF